MPSGSADINLPRLTSEVRQRHTPVVTPDTPLNQQQTETYWRADRASLVMCEAEKATLITYHDVLAQQLAANLRR